MDTQALRQKILDLAIRGKLIPQDPTDEPASVLLERIRAEKQQMVKDGKLKAKDIKGDTVIFKGEDNLHYEKFQDGTVKCIEDEIPFEVPEGWAWCRFGTYTINRDSERKPISLSSRKDVEKIYDYYGASGKIDKIDNYLFDETLLLIGEDGANLVTRTKPIAFFATGTYWVNNHAHCIDAVDKDLLSFLCFYVNAIDLKMYVTGAAQPKLNQDNMNRIMVPIPSLNEQQHIVLAINAGFNSIDVVEKHIDNLQEEISFVKSKILDLAIRGKLIPQDPTDEPASVLLDRIRAEKEGLIKQGKIKHDKNDSIIYKGDDNSYYEKFFDGSIKCIDEDIPFDIPNSWQWVRLNNLVVKEIKRGKAPKYSDDTTNTLVFAQKCNLKAGGIKTELAKFLDETVLSKYPETEFLTVGDIVINSTGTGTLGRVGIFEEILISIVPDTHVTVIRVSPHICSQYIYCVLKESQPVLEDSGEGSTNQKELRPNTLISFLVPLPPLDEQIRIASIITETNKVLWHITKKIS